MKLTTRQLIAALVRVPANYHVETNLVGNLSVFNADNLWVGWIDMHTGELHNDTGDDWDVQ
jgi:hypothetical protein